MTSHELPLNSRGFTPLMPLYLSLFIISSRWPDYDIWANTRMASEQGLLWSQGAKPASDSNFFRGGRGSTNGWAEREERASHRLAGVVASPHISESVLSLF